MPSLDGDIPSEQDLGHQRVFWAVQRAAWAAAALVLSLAFLGVFAKGVFSNAVAGDRGSPLWVEYSRWEHYQAPAQWRLHMDSWGTVARLTFNPNLFEHIQVERIDPPPHSITIDSNSHSYDFRVTGPAEPLTVVFRFKSDTAGPVKVSMSNGRGAARTFRFWVLP